MYTPTWYAEPAEPQYDPIQSTRIVMSLIAQQFDESTGNLELIELADANNWAESFYDAYGPLYYPEGHASEGEPIPWASLTSEQKGRFYLRQLRKYHIEVRRGTKIPAATDAAKATAEAQVVTDSAIFPEIED